MSGYQWRTRNASYVYVDSITGSDLFGDGTQANPYQSLGKAWRGHTTYHPSTIVCRGVFSEDMCDGYNFCTIMGDYWGAATFDGQGLYLLCNFYTPNMIFCDVPHGTRDLIEHGVNFTLAPVAGIGRMYSNQPHTYSAGTCTGTAASKVMLARCALLYGVIGGHLGNASSFNVIASPVYNPSSPFTFSSYSASKNATCTHFTAYDIAHESRAQSCSVWFASRCLMGKVAFYSTDQFRFSETVFTCDCTWWHNNEQFIPQGATDEEKMASLKAWAAEHGGYLQFDDECRLLDLTSYEVFNDPDNADLTLRLDAMDELMLPDGDYPGGLPFALHVPVLSDSEGVPGSWDETTADGLISVAGDAIIVGSDDEQVSLGSIKSKIITLDPDKVALSGIFSQYSSLSSAKDIILSQYYKQGKRYEAGQELPIGRYRVKGAGGVNYGEVFVPDGDVLVVTQEGTSFADPGVQGMVSHVEAIEDDNVVENISLRSTNLALPLRSKDGLQAGGQYLNAYGKPITYRGRHIVPGESFEAANDTDTFHCEGDEDYRVLALFDDSRVPTQPLIPASMWGQYFAGKLGNTYQKDSEGVPLGSGNYKSFIPQSVGGYSELICRTPAHSRYVQLIITAQRL